MRMDADRNLHSRQHRPRGRGHGGRQGAPIGITKHDAVCPAFDGRKHGRDRIGRVFLPAIDRMFAVIDDFAAMGFQKGHRITDHRQVFLRRTAQHFTDMQR